MARKCIVWWSSDTVTLERICSIIPFQPNIFRLTPASPPPTHFKAPNATVLSATSPKPPAPHTQTHGTVPFLCIEKKNHTGSKEAKCLTIT